MMRRSDVIVFGSDYCGSRRAAGHCGAPWGHPFGEERGMTPLLQVEGIAQNVTAARIGCTDVVL